MECRKGDAAKTGVTELERNQPPILDFLGPYPDEIIMTALDRILYYVGATKIMRLFDSVSARSVTPRNVIEPSSASSYCSLVGDNSKTSCCTPKAKDGTSRMLYKQSTCSIDKLKPESPSKDVRQRSPRVDFTEPANNSGFKIEPSVANRIKRSISVHSLPGKRMYSGKNAEENWLWTRMVNQDNGYKIYEVYRDSKMNHALDRKKTPALIFLIMPNGYIVPFETVSHP